MFTIVIMKLVIDGQIEMSGLQFDMGVWNWKNKLKGYQVISK